MTGRGWCFTINNPQEEDLKLYDQEWIDKAGIKILVFQGETGLDGTNHYQGYVEFNNSIRQSQLKKLLPRAHLEKRKGSRVSAMTYCTKEETRTSGPTLYGITEEELDSLKRTRKSSTGSRNSTGLQEIQDLINKGEPEINIANDHFDLWVRHYRAFERYRCLTTKPRNFEVAVHVYYGPTGTGKSKLAMERFPNAYWKQRSNWWCGYSGEPELIIDEFYGWLPYDLLLRICDRYPLLLETKGGQVQCLAKTIIITSNLRPDLWYKSCYFPALERRLHEIHWMPELGKEEVFSSYDEFKERTRDKILLTN